MKKVGILTLPLHINYGGILQAFALYHTIETLGYQPYLISTKALPRRISTVQKFKIQVKKAIVTAAHIVKPNIVDKVGCMNILATNINSFVRNNIPNVLTPRNFEDFRQAEIEAIVVGSDQVWRPQYAGDIRMFFLSFADGWDIRRIAYAASFGTSEWTFTPEETADCAKLLKKFDRVSVREEDGVRLCHDKFGVEAKWTLDPTMLLAKADYLNVASRTAQPDTQFVTYVLDANNAKRDVVSALEKKLGKQSKTLKGNLYIGHDARQAVPWMGVDEWLGRLANSSFVLTDSFHGCVFSIIFNRPFVIMINKDRGSSRFGTLLSKFDLTGRIAANAEDAVRIADEAIDWDAVNKMRDELREQSLKFLREALSGKNV